MTIIFIDDKEIDDYFTKVVGRQTCATNTKRKILILLKTNFIGLTIILLLRVFRQQDFCQTNRFLTLI